ncbi:hypothetical protein PAQ31011_01946 [Pandoraea aquatica]|uniref:Uncharacterized protein n=1 Tax=Pandoraea aquatica TaxID=2508290 RepID=A0A5E4UFX6_9BURK|nr:hypothetical protein [Pandoraea aquatica]VVD97139.1 hypothetical protein PAQ31011_01946 [Pandoraea aquatica]
MPLSGATNSIYLAPTFPCSRAKAMIGDVSEAFSSLTQYLEGRARLNPATIEAHRQWSQRAPDADSLSACFVDDDNVPEIRLALFRLHLASYPKGLSYLTENGEVDEIEAAAALVLRDLTAESREAMLAAPELADNGVLVVSLPDTRIRIVLHPECLSPASAGVTEQEASDLLLRRAADSRDGALTLLERMLTLRDVLDPELPDPLAIQTWHALAMRAHWPLCHIDTRVTKQHKEELGFILHSLATYDDLRAWRSSCLWAALDAFECAENDEAASVVRQEIAVLDRAHEAPLREPTNIWGSTGAK